MFQREVVQKINNTCLMLSKFFSPKIVAFVSNVEKYGTARQATDDNILGRREYGIWMPAK
jgi:hypothetical protein